jgi:hypothetical protein
LEGSVPFHNTWVHAGYRPLLSLFAILYIFIPWRWRL